MTIESRCLPRPQAEPPSGSGARQTRTSVAVLAELPLIGQGLRELIRGMGLFEVAGATSELEDVLDLVACGAARVVVISTAGREHGFAQRALDGVRYAAADVGDAVGTVLVLSASRPGPDERADLGSTAVVTTDAGVDGLAHAVFEARRCSRPSVRSPRSRRTTSSRTRPDTGRPVLTPRELEVLQGMADGLASKHIAERLGVSVHTVRTHVQRLLPKLGAHTRLRATAVALEEGLVAPRSATRLATRYSMTAAGAGNDRTAE